MTTLTSQPAPPAAPEAMVPRLFRVTATQRETADTATLRLEPERGEGFEFRPGQYTMLTVFGVGEVPISISGSPHRPETLVHTIRAVGAVTEALVGMRPGEPVGVRGPFGVGWPVAEAESMHVLLVAGGIGLAPLRPSVLDVLARREQFARLSLVYGARTQSDLIYRHELAAWRSRSDIDVEVTVDVSDAGWSGDVGMVTGLLPRVPLDPGAAVAMVCGPEIMMRFTAAALVKRGVAAERIQVSLERNMECAIAHCGHCQLGPVFVCREGPVFDWASAGSLLEVRAR
jgi:NAD(P)H-flavin reductase